MLYYLFSFLDQYDIPGSGMFKYISFRSILSFIIAMFMATVIGKRIIDRLQLKQVGEVIRDLGLEGQLSKKGTPTMGGVIIIISILVPVLLFGRLDNIYMALMIITTLWMGGIGFMDDYIKVFKKHKEGMKARTKIVGQVGLGLIIGMILYLSPSAVIRENTQIKKGDNIETVHSPEHVKSTKTTIPFFKNNNLDYADFTKWLGDYAEIGGWILFVLVTIIVVTAVSNGANLTDGLDGLATGISAIIGIALGILAYVSSHVTYASYLNIMFIPGTEELVVFISAFTGATIGFLWFNSFPAQVFMGDTGSLTLGGIIGVFAMIIHKELLVPILCGMFFVESLSVLIQVSYFKFTKKRLGVGKRIFKMSPIHHHFQKAGNAGIDALLQFPIRPIPESKIVVRFWIVSIILAAITIITLKVR
ncbi:MAG: phospho-N-acetylmuramoyl-pentapeptide-transferase [Bacteroidales bacterium]|nr:phospho-N-acetylmuramoyl-pentapeptide-transferase [Bacteroidales bacterium]MDD4822184.1 phospho-N-acetylmuramoyl-pentapeptide-transferase [Bacteroidales bacterium]